MDPELMAQHDEIEAHRRRDRWLGLAVIVLAFGLGIALSYWARVKSQPEVAEPPAPPSSEGLVGFPKEVEPLAALGAARLLTRRSLLRGVVLEGVEPNGTVDVSAPGGRVRFSFQSAQGQGPQPKRDPGTLPRRHYCGKQNVHLHADGLVADPDITDFPCPATPQDPLPEPRCGPREVWAHAITAGAPRDRRARIEYYRSRIGPAWRFELVGTSHRFSLYGDCGREIDGKDAVGSVP